MNDLTWLDGALYPDMETPTSLDGLPDQVDFLARLCSAWDFGLLPNQETIAEIRRPGWKAAVEACRLPAAKMPGRIRECLAPAGSTFPQYRAFW